MASTQLQVCNYALALVGAEPITQANLTSALADTELTTGPKAARLCATFYTVVLKDLLRESNWNFAKETVELSAISGDVSEGGWTYDFTLPTDYLEMISIHYTDNGGEVPDGEWEVYEDTLYCNHSEISIKYIKYVSEPDSWSHDFRRLFSWSLAEELSYPLSGSNEQHARILDKVEMLKRTARFNNARENSRQDLKINAFTNARRGFE